MYFWCCCKMYRAVVLGAAQRATPRGDVVLGDGVMCHVFTCNVVMWPTSASFSVAQSSLKMCDAVKRCAAKP